MSKFGSVCAAISAAACLVGYTVAGIPELPPGAILLVAFILTAAGLLAGSNFEKD